MFLIKLPSKLPIISTADGGKDVNAKSKPPVGTKKGERLCELKDLPSGFMGKMLVYKSGKIKLKLGNTLYDVSILHSLHKLRVQILVLFYHFLSIFKIWSYCKNDILLSSVTYKIF